MLTCPSSRHGRSLYAPVPFLPEQPGVSATLRNPGGINTSTTLALALHGLRGWVLFRVDTTGLSSIVMWQRNAYLILFLIAYLVANVMVLRMHCKCFSRSDCAHSLETILSLSDR